MGFRKKVVVYGFRLRMVVILFPNESLTVNKQCSATESPTEIMHSPLPRLRLVGTKFHKDNSAKNITLTCILWVLQFLHLLLSRIHFDRKSYILVNIKQPKLVESNHQQ